MRSALALLLTLVLTVPATLATAPTTFSAHDVCLAGGTYVLGAAVALPGCSVQHEGAIEVLGCEGTLCELSVSISAHLRGAPAGHASLATITDDEFGANFVATLCSTERVGTGADLRCEATGIATVAFSDGCRFIVVETNAVVNQKLAATRLLSTFRACLADGEVTFETV